MIVKSLPFIVVALVSFTVSAADTYRWEDAQGRVYYSDQLPPAGARNVRRAQVDDNGNPESLPYRLQLAVENAPVTLYVTDCGRPCKQARQLLVERGIPHKLLDASSAEVQQQLTVLTDGSVEVPVVTIGKTVLRGFEEGQWNGALDAAGYPSYAMIKVKPQTPSKGKKQTTAATQEEATGNTGYDSAETESSEPEVEDTVDDGVDTQSNETEQAEPADAEQAQ